MDEVSVNPNAAPAAPALTAPVKKPRKPRTPKVKPPKKERVALGSITLVRIGPGRELNIMETQPPVDVASDINKVEQWAATIEGLAGMEGVRMIRMYNATLKVASSIKLRATLALDSREVPQSNQTA